MTIYENKLFYCLQSTKKIKEFMGKIGFKVILKPIAIFWIMKGLRILVLTFWVSAPPHFPEAVYVQQMDQIVARLTH